MTTEEKLARCGIEIVAGWAIVKNEEDFTLLQDFVRADYPGRPDSYPCAAMETITADESTEYLFIYKADLAAMSEKMDLNPVKAAQ